MPDARELALIQLIQQKVRDDNLLIFLSQTDAGVRARVLVEVPVPEPRFRARRTTVRDNRKEQERENRKNGHLGALKAAFSGLELPTLPEQVERGYIIDATPQDIQSLCELACVGSIRYP